MTDIAAFCWDLSAALDVENIEVPRAKIEGLATRLIEAGYTKESAQPAVPRSWQVLVPAWQAAVIVAGVPQTGDLYVETYDATTGEVMFDHPTRSRTNGGELMLTYSSPCKNDMMVRVVAL